MNDARRVEIAREKAAALTARGFVRTIGVDSYIAVKELVRNCARLDLVEGHGTGPLGELEPWVPAWVVAVAEPLGAFRGAYNGIYLSDGSIISHGQIFSTLEGKPELCAAIASAYALGGSKAVADLLCAEGWSWTS